MWLSAGKMKTEEGIGPKVKVKQTLNGAKESAIHVMREG